MCVTITLLLKEYWQKALCHSFRKDAVGKLLQHRNLNLFFSFTSTTLPILAPLKHTLVSVSVRTSWTNLQNLTEAILKDGDNKQVERDDECVQNPEHIIHSQQRNHPHYHPRLLCPITARRSFIAIKETT